MTPKEHITLQNIKLERIILPNRPYLRLVSN